MAAHDALRTILPVVGWSPELARTVEFTGGTDPIRCHGHRKGDAVQMKTLIERYQNEYYRGGGRPSSSSGPPELKHGASGIEH